jgi:hypothetical protein
MTSPTFTVVPDQAERASQLIELWLTLDLEAQGEALARLIAAAVHSGPGSALERFAGTGVLDPQGALEEINWSRVPLDQEPWLDTLGRFVLSRGGRS